MKSPYKIIKNRYNTEKARVMENLQHSESSKSLRKCKKPKYVFEVDIKANKKEIAQALEKIYLEKKIKVLKVNTVVNKPKARRVRGQVGKTASMKKAIVTLAPGDAIDDQV
jgi:large subunit ribosomal protein L23